MEDKSLTLCITCYDGDAHLLSGLLHKLKAQTVAPDEILVSYSGIAQKGWAPDKITINSKSVKVNLVGRPERHAQGSARNLGAQHSKSNYIMFFDVDDIPHDRKIELCKKHLKNYDFLLHGYMKGSRFSQNDWDEVSHIIECPEITNISINPTCTNISAVGSKGLTHGHITVKKEIFNSIKYQESTIRQDGEDGKFCQSLVKAGYNGVVLNTPLIIYVQ